MVARDYGEGEIRSYFLVPDMDVASTYNMMKVLNATELYTLNWLE